MDLKRTGILQAALGAVDGLRDDVYGDPTANHERIARLWTTVFGHKFTASDVVLAMVLVKVSRLSNTPTHEDSWVDIAGYAAIGGEIATVTATATATATATTTATATATATANT